MVGGRKIDYRVDINNQATAAEARGKGNGVAHRRHLNRREKNPRNTISAREYDVLRAINVVNTRYGYCLPREKKKINNVVRR